MSCLALSPELEFELSMTSTMDSSAAACGEKFGGLIEEDSGEEWSMKNRVLRSFTGFS